ncbi:MAG: hypothetical protein AB8I08_23595 [Sandaracinaceae bacterium]
MPRKRDKRSTLPESKRGSLAKLAHRLHVFCEENALGDRMQVLLYGVVEGLGRAELEERLEFDLAQAESVFRTVTGRDVHAVAKDILAPSDSV